MFALKEASEIILSTPFFYVKLNTLLSMSEGMSHVFVQTKKKEMIMNLLLKCCKQTAYGIDCINMQK